MDLLSAKFGFLYISSGFSNGRREEFWPVDLGQLRFSFWMRTTKSLAVNWQYSHLCLYLHQHICLINQHEISPRASAHHKLPGSSSKPPLQIILWHTEWHVDGKVRSKNKNPQRPPRNNVTTQLHKGLPPFPGQPPTPQHPIVSPFVPIITWKLSSAGAESSSPTQRRSCSPSPEKLSSSYIQTKQPTDIVKRSYISICS